MDAIDLADHVVKVKFDALDSHGVSSKKDP